MSASLDDCFMFAEKSKEKRKSILLKVRLIGVIIVDYVINLFNRSSRDFRAVSYKLAEMKSEDKRAQQERLRAESSVGVVRSTIFIALRSVHSLRFVQASVISIDDMAGGDRPNR